MSGFDLTDEQRLVEQSVREWAGREVAPRIRQLDRDHQFDRDRILGGMSQLGLLGVCVPQEYGGAGLDYVCLGLASEELEYVDTSLRVILSVHTGLNCLSLLTWGTEAQKQQYLVPQAQGRKIAGYALTEPGAGSDARAIQTTAVRKGDRYVLSGEKTWISLADVADHFLVFAWTDAGKKQQRPAGISAFIERQFKGFTSGPMKKLGHPAGKRVLQAGQVAVGENMLDARVKGSIAMSALDRGLRGRGHGAHSSVSGRECATRNRKASAPRSRSTSS
jgi:glutaryl-CoA dehydrogenase (non-decarboxylating)